MRKSSIRKTTGILLALLFLAFNYSPLVQDVVRFPAELQIFEGETQILDFGLPLQAKVSNNNEINVLKFNGDTLKEKQVYDISRPLSIESISQGNVNIDFMLFGFIPVKKLTINVTSAKKLVPGETQ